MFETFLDEGQEIWSDKWSASYGSFTPVFRFFTAPDHDPCTCAVPIRSHSALIISHHMHRRRDLPFFRKENQQVPKRTSISDRLIGPMPLT